MATADFRSLPSVSPIAVAGHSAVPLGNVTDPMRRALLDLLQGPATWLPSENTYCAGRGRQRIHPLTAKSLYARCWVEARMVPLLLTPEGRRVAEAVKALGDLAADVSRRLRIAE
jgi:hypothetical protein